MRQQRVAISTGPYRYAEPLKVTAITPASVSTKRVIGARPRRRCHVVMNHDPGRDEMLSRLQADGGPLASSSRYQKDRYGLPVARVSPISHVRLDE